MTFAADYPGAIVLEAATYGYDGKPGTINRPRAIGLHTPEEPADANPSTPYYFHNLFNREASTTYFLAFVAHPGPAGPTHVFQCVPESAGAYGNAVEGKPYPAWADPNTNLNLQTISIEIEGYAHNIHQTMPRGSDQWKALVDLLRDICRRRPLVKIENTFGHYLVSTNRSDPGQLDIAALIADVKEDDMTPEESARLNTTFLKVEEIWTAMFGNERDSIEKAQHREILAALGGSGGAALSLTPNDITAIAEKVADTIQKRLTS